MSPDKENDARAAFGNPEMSQFLHDKRQSFSMPAEPYNQDSRCHSSLTNKALIYSGLHGCAVSAVMLALVRSARRLFSPQGGSSSSEGASHPGAAATSRHALSRDCQAEPKAIAMIVCATAVPCGISMGYLLWLAMHCEREVEHRERNREQWEMENYRDGEIAEMVGIYRGMGFTQEETTQIVNIYAKNDKAFVDWMMVEELGYSRFPFPTAKETFFRGTLPAIVAHSVCLVLPLIPLLQCNRDSRKSISRLAEGCLVAQTLGLSVLQGLLLYGAYASTSNVLPVVAANASWLAGLYFATRGVSGYVATALLS